MSVHRLILYVPSTVFQLNRDGSSWGEHILSKDKCVLLKDNNAVTPVRLEPAASRSRVKHSATALPTFMSVKLYLFPYPSLKTCVLGAQKNRLNSLRRFF